MTATRQPGRFRDHPPAEIEAVVRAEGWDPVPIGDLPGTVYPPHRHPEAKLLVFLRGSMIVETDGERIECCPGDCLVIPGNQEHAAFVGEDGCTFFWSEQRRG